MSAGVLFKKKIFCFLANWIAFSVAAFFLSRIVRMMYAMLLHDPALEEKALQDVLGCALFGLFFCTFSDILYRLSAPWLRYKVVLVLVLVSDLLVSVACAFTITSCCWFLFYDGVSGAFWVNDFVPYFFMAIILSLLFSLGKIYMIYIDNLRSKERLELNLFKHQLDPHFLFNSISFVLGLIDDDPQTAKQCLRNLSLAYRYLLSHSMGEKVYVSEAIRFIHIYTSFLVNRYPGHFKITIDPKLEDCLDYILPFSLQMLIENAVKHNKHSVEAPLCIEVKRDYEYLVVSNTYKPIRIVGESYKLGLDNLVRRYEISNM